MEKLFKHNPIGHKSFWMSTLMAQKKVAELAANLQYCYDLMYFVWQDITDQCFVSKLRINTALSM